MNFAAKFDGLLSTGGQHPHGDAKLHTDAVATHAPEGAIVIPDAQLLFGGDFKRSGVDLVLSKGDQELVLHDYFKGEKRAALASPDGAHLTGDLVSTLSGHTQFAQAAGTAATATVIGHVTKLVGNATAIRNGVAIVLNQGDNVNKGDVVQSGSDSTLGITFIDGTVFGLASNAKMVLNEMVYDPNGSNNSSLLSLVQGTISFVAGATAKHGDMKVDTPVATMGIRGTAVLVEIDFEVQGGSAPPAKFQVLVEPDGTTGSYILFDKTTLTPIATVNQAGTQTIISGNGAVSFLSAAQLSVDAQNLINQLFAWKFTNADPNPKSDTHFTDTIVPNVTFGYKLPDGTTITAIPVFVPLPSGPAQSGSGPEGPTHISGPPIVVTSNGVFAERAGVTASSQIDKVSGNISYADVNPNDIPSASVTFDSYVYKDAKGNAVSAGLTAEQLAAIKAVEVPLQLEQDPARINHGTATWTYSLSDGAFDFLAAGETLTLTYMARVDTNFTPANEFALRPITITITGTNDLPTIATAGGTIIERVGTGNTALDVITGTVTFTDVDLTDRPIVSASLSSSQPYKYLDAEGHDVTANLTDEQKAAIAAVEVDLSVVQTPGNGHNGSATWTYSVVDHAFDFLADDETLVLNYVIQVDDGHGGVVSTPVTISINGADVTVTGTNDIPTIATTSNAFTELSNEGQPNPTGSMTPDTVSGTISFTDVDLTDRPVASAAFTSFTYRNSSHTDVTSSLSPEQLAAIAAVEVPVTMVQNPGNSHDGSATWTYSLADGAFDFLGQGEVLTLTYTATVDDGHGGVVTKPFTVTITGTNDTPTVAATSNAFVELSNGDRPTPTGTGSDAMLLGVVDTVSGTISFSDVDLTDRPVASAAFTSFSYQNAEHTDVTASLTETQLAAIAAVEVPVTVVQGAGNGHDGTATWTYSLSDGAFDFLGEGEVLTLTYTATVDDGHGGVITTPFTVTVTGTNDTPTISSGEQVATIGEIADVHDSDAADVATGTITFHDVDLTDTHDVAITGVSASGTVTGLANHAAQLGWLSLGTLTDSTNGVTGSEKWTFSAPDHYFDYLADGESVTLTYTVEVDDHHGGVTSQDVVITVTGSNDAPQLAADVSGAEGTTLHAITEQEGFTGSSKADTASGSLAFRDVDLSDTHTVGKSGPSFAWSDSSGHALSLSLTQIGVLTAASALTLTLHDSTGSGLGSVDFSYGAADQTFDFLAAGETLTITYDITVADEHHVQSTRPVTITVTGSNDAPVAHADSDTGHIVEAGNDANNNVLPGVSTTTGNVLANDTDVDLSDSHDVVGVAAGTATGDLSGGVGTTINGIYGWLVLGADGGWTYTLDNSRAATDALAQGAHASDVFSYTESDHHGGTSTATLTIDITGTNDAPVTNAAPVALTDVNHGAAVVEQGVNPGNSAFAGNDSATGNVLANDFDVDTGDTKVVQGVASGTATGPLTGNVATTVTGVYGSVTIAADGTWTYTLNNEGAATQALTQGQHVADVFTYTMHDALGSTASATLTIDITGTNDAPTLAAVTTGPLTDTAGYDSFGTITGSLVGNDVDSGETATLSYAALDAGAPVHSAVAGLYGSLTVNADGSYVYVPDAAAINALHKGIYADTFTVQTTDINGATGTATFTVNVQGANDTATIDGRSAGALVEDATTVVNSGQTVALDTESGVLTVHDVDSGEAHFQDVDPAALAGQYGTFTFDSATGAWTYHLDNAKVQYLGDGITTTDTLTVTSADGTAHQDIVVTITGTNDAATIEGKSTGALVEDATTVVNSGQTVALDTESGVLTVHDADSGEAHFQDADPAALTGQYGTFTFDSATGAWTYHLDNAKVQYLGDGITTTDTLTVSSADGTAHQDIVVTITGTNDAATIEGKSTGALVEDATTVVNSGQTVALDTESGVLTVHDVDSGQAHFQDVDPAALEGQYGSFTFDSATGAWTYHLDNAKVQYLGDGITTSDTLAVTSADGTAHQDIVVTITGINDAPTLADVNAGALSDNSEDFTLAGTLTGTDPDSGETASLSYAALNADGLPVTTEVAGQYGTLTVNADGSYSYVADPAAIQALPEGNFVDSFTVQTTDIHGAHGTATLTVDVTGANDDPRIAAESNPPTQALLAVAPISPVVLPQGENDNSLQLPTETFDGQRVGDVANNGAGYGDFHSEALDATFTGSGAAGIVSGSSSVSAAPFVGPLPGSQDTTSYLSIGAGGTETISFGHENNAFGLYWGSVDAYNTVSFYDHGILVGSYTGADISPLFSNGNQGSFSASGYVQFAGLHAFDTVVLGSGSAAFEIDDISAGNVTQPHVGIGAAITGTLSVHDADIGDVLTAYTIGDGTVSHNGGAVPADVDVSQLIDAASVTFDSVQSDGGTDVLHWTYHPQNADLDFLHPGDVLNVQFEAAISDGHGNVGSQPLTVSFVGANNATILSNFSFVNGTSGDDTFNNLGGNTTVFGNGGHDTFLFKPGFGSATIGDFDVNNDTIGISSSLFGSIADILAAAAPANTGLDTVITDAVHHNAITLKGVTVAQLQASDFHLT